MDPCTTLAVYFEITNSNANPLPPQKRRFIQFVTTYQHSNGRTRLRATTLCGPWHGDPNDASPIARFEHMHDQQLPNNLLADAVPSTSAACKSHPCLFASARSFDQEASAVLMARIATHRTESEEVPDVLRWVIIKNAVTKKQHYHQPSSGAKNAQNTK